tara:strand:+ start:253 stop:771 length:519 start_codon:yes stop_codon:yes gene_type:complete
MVRVIISFLFLFLSYNIQAQRFLTRSATISFFSRAPLEDINAENNEVSVIYDTQTKKLAFQLNIRDFIFPIPLMQEHFNENYLESDRYPLSTFTGDVSVIGNKAKASGKLNIHGVTNSIIVSGVLEQEENRVIINTTFKIRLEDYGIKIPRIVIYNIAEEIEIKVIAKLNKM